MSLQRTLPLLAGLLAGSGVLAQTNVAPAGIASQISTDYGGVASRAIDGDTQGFYWANSVTSTAFEVQPWWQVVLAVPVPVEQVVVWNRTDCCSERLSDYTVSLWFQGEQVDSRFFAGTSPVSASFSFADVVADTVRIQLSGSNWLSLAEVQVFTSPVPEPQGWVLMLGGVGLIGLALRRREQRARAKRGI